MLDNDSARHADLVAPGLPASIESLDVVVATDTHSVKMQAVGATGAETELPVVLERTALQRNVLAREFGAATIGVFEHTVATAM